MDEKVESGQEWELDQDHHVSVRDISWEPRLNHAF